MSEREYYDIAGMKVTLMQLIARDPEWAHSRIKRCEELEEELNRRAPEAGQQELISDLAMLLRRFISLSRPISESSALQNISKKALDFLARHSLSGNPLRDAENKPQAQAEPISENFPPYQYQQSGQLEVLRRVWQPHTQSNVDRMNEQDIAKEIEEALEPAEGQEPVLYQIRHALPVEDGEWDIWVETSQSHYESLIEDSELQKRKLYAQPQRPAVPDVARKPCQLPEGWKVWRDQNGDYRLDSPDDRHLCMRDWFAEKEEPMTHYILAAFLRDLLTAAPAPERPEE